MSRSDLHRLVDSLPDDVVNRIDKHGLATFVITREEGRLELREIDPEQAWFWTPQWQAGEHEADAELAAGQGTIYYSDEEFLRASEADLEPLR